nr:unnamed protein product [Callosobruchus analis]
MVLDHSKTKEENVTIIEDMDVELFKELLLRIKAEL